MRFGLPNLLAPCSFLRPHPRERRAAPITNSSRRRISCSS